MAGMDLWRTETTRIVTQLLGNPDSTPELVFILAVVVLTATMVMNRAAAAMGARDSNLPKALTVVAIAIVITLVALIPCQIHFMIKVPSPTSRFLVSVAVCLFALGAIAIPAATFILRINYLQALFSVILTVAAAVFIVFLVNAGIDAVRHGGSSMGKARSHKDAVNELPWK